MKNIYDVCGPKKEQDNFSAYWSSCIAASIFGWCDEWVKRGMQETPKQMSNLV